MRTMTSILLVALLSSGSNASARSTSKSTSRSNTSLLKAADELASAVRARDVSALLRFVPPNGIACIDSPVTRRDLEKQLRTPDTFLGAYFLAPETFRRKFASPMFPESFAEFLATNRDIRVTVPDDQDRRSPCVNFLAGNVESAHFFCFRRYGHRWVPADLPNCA